MTADTAAYNELLRLESTLSRLVQQRNEAIAQATEDIAEANRWFDSECLPVSRRINELRAELGEDTHTEAPVRRKREKKLPEPDPEWSDEEQEHFARLARGR